MVRHAIWCVWEPLDVSRPRCGGPTSPRGLVVIDQIHDLSACLLATFNVAVPRTDLQRVSS